MQTMRFSAIAADLERKIRAGAWAEKMPTTPELVRLYHCGKCTVTNALRPLVQSGLLHGESRRGGLLIDRTRLRSGVIGIVGRWSAANLPGPESPFNRTLTQMRQDGFEPVMIRFNSEQDTIGSIRSFRRNMDGLIFTSSTLNEELALLLENEHIPFISCNRLPLNRRLNFIGFDLFSALGRLLDLLTTRGCRTVAFMIPGKVEGFNLMARNAWIRLKRSRRLPILPCDRPVLNWRDSIEEQLRRFLACCRENELAPDAMILWRGWNGLSPEMLQMLYDTFSIPERTVLIAIGSESDSPPPGHLLVRMVDNAMLAEHAYEALRELIYAPSKKVIKRFVPQPEPWLIGEIPQRH